MIRTPPLYQTSTKSPAILISIIAGILLITSCVIPLTLMGQSASAVSTSGFKAGDIMSNAVMSNSSTMSESQIKSFLLSKNTCDKTVASAGGDVIDDSATKAHWKSAPSYTYQIRGGKKGTTKGTFNCLAKSSFDGESASHIIYQAAQDYQINPQVLIVLLQKEQGLVTEMWPQSAQLGAATGYDCPDHGQGCDPDDAGFKSQVRGAALLFDEVLSNKDLDGDNFITNYPVGTNKVYYNPSSSCGFSMVDIKNRATSALYRYTPYQPNSATLAAGWPMPGNIHCEADGNLNFYMYFTQWFGNTHYSIEGSIRKYYNAHDGINTLGEATDRMHSDGHGFYWQKFENGYIAGQSNTGYYAIVGSIEIYYGAHSGSSLLGKPLGEEKKDSATGIWSQAFAKGHIIGSGSNGYFAVRGKIDTSYQKYGGINKYGQPLADLTRLGSGANSQQFQNGYLVGSYTTGYYESSGATRAYWLANGTNTGKLGLPKGNIHPIGNGEYQLYEGGVVIGNTSNGYFGVVGSIGDLYTGDVSVSFDNLGFPIANEKNLGGAYSQQFDKGYITGASGHYYRTSTAIYNYWLANGAQNGRLGLPKNRVMPLTGGEYQKYKGGAVIGSPSTNYYAVKGSIGKTYLSNVSRYYNNLGLPVANESKSSGIWQQQFEKGYITAGKGAYFDSFGPIRSYWLSIGGWNGKMGLITGPVTNGSRGMIYQHYENGVLIINPNSGDVWESKGSIRVVWGELGYQSGKMGYPTGPEKHNSSTNVYSQTYEHGTIETRNGKRYKVIYN